MEVAYMPYRIKAYGNSDIGLVRRNNEDVWAELHEQNFFVLADGMGGHLAGEVAAQEAVNALSKIVKKRIDSKKRTTLDQVVLVIREAIEEVNRIVHRKGRSSEELRGMGTTLCCMHFHFDGLVLAHVGDSRIYRLRDGNLEQMTQDHSLASELGDYDRIGQDESGFTYKNIITKAIGTEPEVDPSMNVCDVEDQDLFLMCTDGLTDLLTLEEMEEILNKEEDLKKATQALIDQAMEKGGHDNVTVVLMHADEIKETKNLS